jgi:hypothetical protein
MLVMLRDLKRPGFPDGRIACPRWQEIHAEYGTTILWISTLVNESVRRILLFLTFYSGRSALDIFQDSQNRVRSFPLKVYKIIARFY